MRSQGCAIQQALTPEATTVVKQAVVLAKRRGHAQVTPLHVANTMLSISTGLFRAACLQAHAHPLQCRALELCFNVALNRLPTLTTPGPMLGPTSAQNHYPAMANALIAAFKRAQAHQRRGSIENQQQPLLGVKIELDQLIISILDDPSVSRVMKEAGFSSTLVKSRVEEAISMKLGSQNHDPSNNIKPNESNNTTNNNDNNCIDEDVKSVIDSLVNKNKKRNSVVVGECIEMLGSLIKEVKVRVEKGDVCHEDLKDMKFVHVGLNSFGNLCKQEVEQKIMELKCLVKSCCLENNKGVILYLDDLKWVNEMKCISNNILGDQYQPRCSYCPIEHIIMEIGKLVSSYSCLVLGIATFQTYMRCKSGQPSLESILSLQAITIPNNSLGLSLIHESDVPSPWTSKKGDNKLMLGGGSEVNMEVQCLPSWLQNHKDENNQKSTCINNSDKEYVPVKDMWKRWSSFYTLSTHASPSPLSSPTTFERSLSFSSIAPSSSTSNFSYYDHHHLTLQTCHHPSFEPKNSLVSDPTSKSNNEKPSFTLHIQNDHNNKEHLQQKQSPYIYSNTLSLTPAWTSSSDIMDQIEPQCSTPRRFNVYNIESLKLICNALERRVPRHKGIVMDIASTILQCRSRMTSRKGNSYSLKGINKEETWLFFQGVDFDAKEMIARELAKVIFGSQDKFVTISLSSFSSTRLVEYSLDDCRYKRLRDEQSCSYIERFAKEISSDPHRVFFVEDIDQVDYSSLIGIKKAIERGTIPMHSIKEEVGFGDAIIILSCENFRSKSRACSPSTKHKQEISPNREVDQKNTIILGDCVPLEETIISPTISLDLNISINDDEDVCDVNHGESMDEIGLLSTVDQCIVFKNHHEIEESF